MKEGNHTMFRLNLYYVSPRILPSPCSKRQINLSIQLHCHCPEETEVEVFELLEVLEIKGAKTEKGGSVERRTQNLHINFPKASTDSETVHVRRKLSETQRKQRLED